MLEANKTGYFPYTPGTNLLFGLNEAVKMLLEEGLRQRVRPPRPPRRGDAPRGARLGAGGAVRRAAALFVVVDRGARAGGSQRRRAARDILEKYNMSLGNGLGRS